jgi:exodeoxyribonuclease VII small subunit
MTDKPVGDMTFEEAMAELERVVSQLESGNVDLEKSITLYERGAALKAHCEKRLKAAEEKVALITLDANVEPKGTTPVEGL